jgi:RNA polymerase sigma-70 factor, ECF subfamily
MPSLNWASMIAQVRPALLAAFEAGGARWPDVALPFDEFAAHIEAIDVADDDLSLRGPDLFLAAACSAGDDAAIRHFDATFVAGIDRRVTRFRLPPDKLDELRQRVRTKLFLGPSPGIRRYRGHAPLGAWLHVTAVRVAIDVAAVPPGPGMDIDLLEVVGPELTPDLEMVRKQYQDRFRTALEDSFKALSAREKTILRLHVVDDLSIDAIGAIYGVHRATAARWIVGIRARVYERLKQEFAARWNASSSELRSIVSLLRHQIHITAKRVLGSNS